MLASFAQAREELEQTKPENLRALFDYFHRYHREQPARPEKGELVGYELNSGHPGLGKRQRGAGRRR